MDEWNIGIVLLVVVVVAVLASVPGFWSLLQQRQPAAIREQADRDRRRIEELERQREADHALIETLREQLAEMRRGLERLTAQIEAAGMVPAWRIPKALMNGTVAAELRRLIRGHFNLEEMTDLVLRLGANPEDIGGDTSMARARELVAWAERNEMLEQLATLVYELRPNIS